MRKIVVQTTLRWVAAAFKVFGVNEFVARFLSGFLGLLCMALIYRLGSKLFGQIAGAAGALVLGASIECKY